MLGLARFEAGICECGFHESLTRDKSNRFKPGERICPVCAGAAQWARMHADADQRVAKSDPNRPAKAPQPSDGRQLFMRLRSETELAAEASSELQTRLGTTPGSAGM